MKCLLVPAYMVLHLVMCILVNFQNGLTINMLPNVDLSTYSKDLTVMSRSHAICDHGYSHRGGVVGSSPERGASLGEEAVRRLRARAAAATMGGRQKKKQNAGKKKKKAGQKPLPAAGAQKMQPGHPEIEESDELREGGASAAAGSLPSRDGGL